MKKNLKAKVDKKLVHVMGTNEESILNNIIDVSNNTDGEVYISKRMFAVFSNMIEGIVEIDKPQNASHEFVIKKFDSISEYVEFHNRNIDNILEELKIESNKYFGLCYIMKVKVED